MAGGRPCTVCIHDNVEEIDRALVSGRISDRALAKHWGISPSAMGRHRKDHVSASLKPVVVDGAPGAGTLDRIEGLVFEAQRVLRNAQAEEQSKDALAAIKELRGLVELIAKVRGELQSGGPTVQVVNISASTEWQEIQSAMIEALAPFPDARQAVSARLLTLDAGVPS